MSRNFEGEKQGVYDFTAAAAAASLFNNGIIYARRWGFCRRGRVAVNEENLIGGKQWKSRDVVIIIIIITISRCRRLLMEEGQRRRRPTSRR